METIVKHENEAGVPVEEQSNVQANYVEVTSNDFCRICLLKRPVLTSLMERIDGVMIPEMLYKLCGRQIEVQQSYPGSVCDRCLCLLVSSFSFLNLFHQQDERLRSYYWSGSIVARLAQYQEEHDDDIDKRLQDLLERNGRLLASSTKEICTKSTCTEHVPPELVSVATNTDAIVEVPEPLVAIKTEPNEAEILDLLEVEHEESLLASVVEAVESDEGEQIVEMKIDVLNAIDHSDEEYEEPNRRTRSKIRLGAQRRSRRLKDVEENVTESEAEDPAEIEMDDQLQPEPEAEQYDDHTEQEAGEIDPLRCYICDFMTESDDQLEEHIDAHNIMLPYECKECEAQGATVRIIKTVSSLHNHFRSHCYPYRCKLCGKRFQRKSFLQAHLEGHQGNLYSCDECGRQFTHRKTWHNHVQRHAAMRTEDFKCEVCVKVFGSRPRLLRHMLSHSGERPFRCRYCPKRFIDRHQLQCHTEMHVKDKECQCDECGENFPNHRKLKEHKMKQHLSGEELEEYLAKQQQQKSTRRVGKLRDEHCPYPGCNYKAKTYGAMYVHKRTKHLCLHKCEVCSKTFAFQNQLNMHMKLHTGEKPFQCDLCGRNFRRSFSYREHMEMHKEEKSYVCNICQKSFKRPRYLTAHMQTHTASRDYSCDICGNSYKANGELKKHIRHKHGFEITEEITETVETDGIPTEVFEVEYV